MEVTPRPLARGPGPPCPEKAPGRAAERALQQPPFLAAHQGARFTAAPERDWIIQLACSDFSKGLTPGKRGFFSSVAVFLPRRPLLMASTVGSPETERSIDLVGLRFDDEAGS